MEFVVNKKLKKLVKIENSKKSIAVKIVWLLECIMFLIVIYLLFICPICYRLKYGELDFDTRMILNSIGLTVLLFLIPISFLKYRFKNLTIGEREYENIKVKDNILIYTYGIFSDMITRNVDSTIDIDGEIRHLVAIDLNRIKNISYNKDQHKIVVEGIMLKKYTSASNTKNIDLSSISEFDTFDFYDYYSPSLYEYLVSKSE